MKKLFILLLLISLGLNGQMNGQQTQKLFPIQTKGGTGFIDRKGKVVIDPMKLEVVKERFATLNQRPFDNSRIGYGVYIESFSEGLAVISWATCPLCRNPMLVYGFIDESGQLTIPPKDRFHRYHSFHQGLARFWYTGYGFIDQKGKEIIKPQFYKASDFSEGLAAVQEKENGKFGFINKRGKLVIPYQFNRVSEFSEGLAAVNSTGIKLGYIDKKGQMILYSNKWKFAGVFSEGLALVQVEVTNNKLYKGYKEHLYGYIDRTGKFVIEPQFNTAFEFSEGKAMFIQTGQNYGYGFIDRKGQVIIQPIYKSAKSFSEGLAAVAVETQHRDEKLWGFINDKGEWVIKPQYKSVTSFSGGLAGVDCDDYERYCKTYIDAKGKIIWRKVD